MLFIPLSRSVSAIRLTTLLTERGPRSANSTPGILENPAKLKPILKRTSYEGKELYHFLFEVQMNDSEMLVFLTRWMMIVSMTFMTRTVGGSLILKKKKKKKKKMEGREE